MALCPAGGLGYGARDHGAVQFSDGLRSRQQSRVNKADRHLMEVDQGEWAILHYCLFFLSYAVKVRVC